MERIQQPDAEDLRTVLARHVESGGPHGGRYALPSEFLPQESTKRHENGLPLPFSCLLVLFCGLSVSQEGSSNKLKVSKPGACGGPDDA